MRFLGSCDVFLRGAFQTSELCFQVMELLHSRVNLWLGADFADLGIGSNIEFHPIGAGESARDFVPHGGGITARPSQNALSLVGVVQSHFSQVINGAVESNPAIVRLVVLGNDRQRNATWGGLRLGLTALGLLQQGLNLSLDLLCFAKLLGVQRSSLLGFQMLHLGLQGRVQVLALEQIFDAHQATSGVTRDGSLDSTDFSLQLLHSCFPEGVPELVRHQVFVHTTITQNGLRPQVVLNLNSLVDVVVHLRHVLACPLQDDSRATRMSVGELCEVIDFTIDGHPAILRDTVAVHF
mmetsp:Transcript_21038/g.45569  ORF Transcript_21038/g.45569 Transcript_21038/m.45569 type:complete len:295 (+) Transcript_21038:884-1768(+)